MSKIKQFVSDEFGCDSNDSDVIIIDNNQEPNRKIIKKSQIEFNEDNFELKNNVVICESNQNKPVKEDINNNNDDNDILELCSITKIEDKKVKKRDTYYDNDYLVDINEVKKRWNIKKLADPNVNLTLKNYRFRLYGERKDSLPQRVIQPGVFFSEENPTTKNNINEDENENEFQQRLEDLRARLIGQKEDCKRVYNKKLAKLNEIHQEELSKIRKTYLIGSIEEMTQSQIANGFYEGAVQSLDYNYRQKLKAMTEFFKCEEDALFALFNSKSFKKGKLSQYAAFDVFQPTSSSKNIYDDGHRRIFCTINAGKNIRIEDEIYNKYYGYN